MEKTVTREMSLNEVLSLDKGTARVFMDFGMTCLGCPFSMMESVEQACAAHGADPDEVVDQLNAYLAEQEN
ncbi:MAG: DUF1858 domain-containing protein [Clostridia bacterium]|nr:DUF1858 domain-containing protein [Clostridia bacterium]